LAIFLLTETFGKHDILETMWFCILIFSEKVKGFRNMIPGNL